MANEKPAVCRTGERTIRFSFQEAISQDVLSKVHSLMDLISLEWDMYIEELVPSYHTITVFFFHSTVLEKVNIEGLLSKWKVKRLVNDKPKKIVRIPVCYEEPFSLDMASVSSISGLSKEEIIKRHTEPLYIIYMMGFLPGFPYLGGLHKSISIPRLNKPRITVTRGSVGIGGSQTGIYPVDSPGGWNIIGKTPLEIYSVHRKLPFLLEAKNLLQFYPITMYDFKELEDEMMNDSEAVYRFVEELSE